MTTKTKRALLFVLFGSILLGGCYLLLYKNDISPPVWPSLPEDDLGKQLRFERTCDRFFAILEVAKQFNTEKREVLSKLGKPSAKYLKHNHMQAHSEWLYSIDRDVEITISFDAFGKTDGYRSTGLKKFGKWVFPETEIK